ncbi:hypothetical protein INR49_017769 [Caranx melampygus]|nr:hypothetical protein INR49_017769 [Caranx melampygus]
MCVSCCQLELDAVVGIICHLGIGHEEDDGEESDLELRTDTDEGATDRFDQTLPAELQVQDVVVFIRL